MAYTKSLVEAPRTHRLLPVKLPLFEGPLDLLLHLIERQELEISTVSLVLVVDQYMQYLNLMRTEMKLEAAGEFLVVAAKLLLIKSRSLLPQPDVPPPPEEEDPASQLARQLEEYRQFKQIAEELRSLKDFRGPMFARDGEAPEITPKTVLIGLDIDRLIASFEAMMKRKLASPEPEEIAASSITQADRILVIEAHLATDRTMKLETLLADCRSLEDVVVTFLTILELLKQRRIRIWQKAAFGPIILSRPAARASVQMQNQTLTANEE